MSKSILVASILAAGIAAGETPRPLDAASLAKIDAWRSLGRDMAFELKVTSFKDQTQVDAYSISGFVGAGAEGKISSLLHFTDPSAVAGRKMLMGDFGMWVLFPRTRNVIRLSPMQILLGEVSNGDVARLTFSEDYDGTIEGCGDEAGGVKVCQLLLKVKPGKEGTTYSTVKLWAVEGTWKPLRAELYSSVGGDRLLKKVEYMNPRKFEGHEILARISLVDGIDPHRRSVMDFVSMRREKLPASSFNKDYLQVWSPRK